MASLDDLGVTDLIELDRGASATVYSARQDQYDREVAVKVYLTPVLDAKSRRRFDRECQTLGRLAGHPNVVSLFGSGFEEDHPFIVMDLCHGGSLQQLLARQGAMALQDVLRIGVKVCSALQVAHANGILHRDIKPGNILLTSYDEPVLSDFGISGQVDSQMSWTVGESLTPIYAAPEVLESGGGSIASDIWSLTSTLYALLSGRAPFADTKGSLVAMISRITNDPVPPIDRGDIPAYVIEILRRGMAKAPTDRYDTARSLAQAMQDAQRRCGFGETEFKDLRDLPSPVGRPVPEPQASSPESTPTVLDVDPPPHRSDPSAGDTSLVRVPAQRRAGTSRKKVALAALIGVALAGGATTAVAMAGGGRHPSTGTSLTAPTLKAACNGLTCSVRLSAGSAAAPHSTSKLDVVFDGSTPVTAQDGVASYTYASNGTHIISGYFVDGSVTGTKGFVTVHLGEWRPVLVLAASGSASHHLTLRVAPAQCRTGSYRLQRFASGSWAPVGHDHPVRSTGVSRITVSEPGRYRVAVTGARVPGGGVCVAAHSAPHEVRATSVATNSSTGGSTGSTTQPATQPTTKQTAPSKPIQPTFNVG